MSKIIPPITLNNATFTQNGTGAVTRSSQSKIAESVSHEDFGILANGATETAAVANFVAQTKTQNTLKFATVASNQDSTGVLLGYKMRQKTATGRVISPVGSAHNPIFNIHLLQYWLQKFNGHYASAASGVASTNKKIVISGDSTTLGNIDGTNIAADPPHTLLARYANIRGYQNVTVQNNGRSGESTADWVSSWLASDIAANADLLILRWGINDPADNQTPDQFLSSLRAGITTYRASKSVFQSSVLLMTPNSTAYIPDGRDEKWHEQINAGIRQIALDLDCAFLDLYALTPRSHGLANSIIFDEIGGYAVHPRQALYVQIANIIADVVFPQNQYAVCNNFLNLTSAVAANNFSGGTTNASIYNGLTMNFSSSSSFVGYAGSVEQLLTFKSIDCATITISAGLGGYNDANQFARGSGRRPVGLVARYSFNAGNSTVLGKISYPALLNGWANFNNGFQEAMYQTTLDGRICLNGLLAVGTLTDGTVIFTLPTAYAPMNSEIFTARTSVGTCRIDITSAGNVAIYGAAGATWVSLSGINFKMNHH